MTTQTQYINIFRGKDGKIYPSGIVHKTAEAAIRAQSNPRLRGKSIFLAQVTWDDEKAAKDDRTLSS